MTTYPLATLAPIISATGIAAPSYDDIFLSLVARNQQIYGADVVLTSDTQDGQWIAVIAQAINDSNAAAVILFNALSPTYAQGTNLSALVKINGLARHAATYSTCLVTITGTAGAIITNGTVSDTIGNAWSLPASVTIPIGASITVTATCQIPGAITASIGALATIGTPTLGWLTVANAAAASPGAAQESDAALRTRQATSTGIAAISQLGSIMGAVSNLPGVTRVAAHENSTGTTDSAGVPGHAICLVVEGGSATAIAATIAATKAPGVGTYGTVSSVVIDSLGIPATINFDPPTYATITVALSIRALTGYTVTIGNSIVAAIASYINGLAMGANVYLTQVIAAAVTGSGAPASFNLTALTMAISPGSPAAADIALTFNQAAATIAATNITLTVT